MDRNKKKKEQIAGTGRILLLVLAMGMIFWGIARGELTEVFLKSTTICLECIGIG